MLVLLGSLAEAVVVDEEVECFLLFGIMLLR